MGISLKVFDYIPELDCFKVRNEFAHLVQRLGVAEWTPVVWICRLLALDNDFGEHIFDNWDEREELEERANALGYECEDLMIVVPDRFSDHEPYCVTCNKTVGKKAKCPECGQDMFVGPDGPCHSDSLRKRFWTDVFMCLTLDLDTIFEEAREARILPIPGEKTINVEEEIAKIKEEYALMAAKER